MCLDSAINTVINLGVAIGTIAVAIAAIGGDRLTARFNPPKARISVRLDICLEVVVPTNTCGL